MPVWIALTVASIIWQIALVRDPKALAGGDIDRGPENDREQQIALIRDLKPLADGDFDRDPENDREHAS